MLAIPKSPPLRLPEHLQRVREMRCLSTGQGPCDPHHIRMGWFRKGEKPPDDWCVPLIHKEHMLLHTLGELAYWRELFMRDRQFVAEVMRGFARSLYGGGP